MSRNDYFEIRDAYLAHSGVKGMKWRFHKYTNKILSGGRNVYQYAQRKATYYGGQAKREFNKAKRVFRKGVNQLGNSVTKTANQAGRRLRAYGTIAGVGLRRAGKSIGSVLNKARLMLKTKYNPGAIGRRISRAYNIYNMNKQTQAKKGTAGVRSVLYKRYNPPKQSDYSKHNPSQRYSPSHYTPKDYSKKKKTGRSASGKGGRW